MRAFRENKGFTLVELSIVLVIIGLLIGGILAAQSLIASSKVNAQIKQIQQFDVAVSNFKARYNGLPGDSKYFVDPGDNDWSIKESPMESTNDDFVTELANFWKHLSEAGFLTKEGVIFDNDASAGIVPGVHVPKGVFTNSAVAVWGATYSSISDWQDYKSNYFLVGRFSDTDTKLNPYTGPLNNTQIPYPVFTPIEALAIDKKADDGVPRTGVIIVARGGGGSSTIPYFARCTTTPAGSGGYNVNLVNVPIPSDKLCYLSFLIGGLTGDRNR